MKHIWSRTRRTVRISVAIGAAAALLPLSPGPTTGAGPAASVPAARDAAVIRDASVTPLRRGDAGVVASRPAFPVTVGAEPVHVGLAAVALLPGRSLSLATPEAGAVLRYRDGHAEPAGDGGWTWRAPRTPGAYALRLEAGDEVVHLTALVMHPATSVQGGRLGDYAIGEYLRTPLRGDPAYLPPEGFVEVAGDDHDILVSPRLILGQFLCKQPGDPRFVALSPQLLVKLEAILDRVAAAGLDPASLVVMSGFRTPAYNRAIGNTTVYSRHLWGDAADIYLDGDGDGVMDDLDGDGRSGTGDAAVLAGLVEEVVAAHAHVRPGGLATYRANAVHGPFVHVDARGHRARW